VQRHGVAAMPAWQHRIVLVTSPWLSSNSTTVMWPTVRSWTVFKPTLPQGSRSDGPYVVPVVVNCSYCTPDDGYGKYPKHVEWTCNKIKILVLHLVGPFVCIYIGTTCYRPSASYPCCRNKYFLFLRCDTSRTSPRSALSWIAQLLGELRLKSMGNSTSRRSWGNHCVLKMYGCCYTASANLFR
jgi:hypothetical protein